MRNSASRPIPRPFDEIPNPQVFAAAEQFRDGFRLMIRQPPFSGVLLPALHCASIALELYLKSLCARELELPCAAPPFGGYIHAQPHARSHRLEDLFDQAPSDIRQLMEDRLRLFDHLHRFSSVRNALEEHNGMFLASRYPFEPTSELSGIEIGAVDELLQLTDDVIRNVSHRWVSSTL